MYLDTRAIQNMLASNGFNRVRVSVKWATPGPNEISFGFSQHPALSSHDFIRGVIAALRAMGHTVLIYSDR